MPIYQFLNEKTGEIKDIFQSMNELHEYQENNIPWRRIYSIPHMSVDSILDPYSSQDFIRATHKKGTMGDIMDRSKEMSQKRADKEGGRDPVKEKYYDNYSKTRKGLVHPDIRKRKSKERLNKLGFGLE